MNSFYIDGIIFNLIPYNKLLYIIFSENGNNNNIFIIPLTSYYIYVYFYHVVNDEKIKLNIINLSSIILNKNISLWEQYDNKIKIPLINNDQYLIIEVSNTKIDTSYFLTTKDITNMYDFKNDY